PPSAELVAGAHVDAGRYDEMYAQSVNDPEGFWGAQAERLDWIKKPTQVKNTNYNFGDVNIEWFADGTLNVAANCIDRHLEKRGDQTAIIFEADDPNEPAQNITYKELHRNVCRTANVLEQLGVRKGDRVVIYLPMIPEAAYAMLACARIGAIHSIVFAG
ncbi:acetyl-coenzyme A synthetase N-terminal domain-containing protein, partial [uncultured Pelagimonas sp.]